jgi:hypothetical protein
MGGDRLHLLFEMEQGFTIKVIGKILLIAILVGSCQTAGAQAAYAPRAFFSFITHPKMYARMQVPSDKQYGCLVKLWNRESHWNPKAVNHSSGAFGIAQFLPTTWGNYKFEYKPKNPIKQIDYGLHYISVRYGSACKAWRHEKEYGWY